MLKAVAQQVFARCQVGTCEHFTLGVVCARCSRNVCLGHGFVTLGAPPESICVACIIADNAVLLRRTTIVAGGGAVVDDEYGRAA